MVRRSVIVMFVVLISLLTAWPVAAARRVELEVLFVVDTSDSMVDELQALCRGLDELLTDLDQRGVTVDATVLGVAERRACAEQWVTQLIPEGETGDKEDWGPAVMDLAQHYDWKPDVGRLIILLSDEGPLRGDPIDGDDERAIRLAVQAAQEHDVMVSPVLGTRPNADLEPLARDLAAETQGRLFISEDPKDDLSDGLRDQLLAAAAQVRSNLTIVASIPTPRELLFDGRVLSTNLVLTILVTLVLGVSATILSNLLGERRGGLEIRGTDRLTAVGNDLGRALGGFLSPTLWSPAAGAPRRLFDLAQLALLVILVAFVGLFLQPGLNPVSWHGLGLGVGLLLALLLSNLIYDGAQCWLAGQAGATPVLRLRPGALLGAVASVLLSRVVGFVPGFFYGRVTRCAFSSKETAPPEPPPVPSVESEEPAEEELRYKVQADDAVAAPRPRPFRSALVGLVAVGAAGLLLWGLTVPTSLLLDFVEGLNLPTTLSEILTGLISMAQGLFLLCFFLTWQMLYFELLPLRSNGGGVLYRRNRLVWAALALGVLFLLLQALVNPFNTPDELLGNGGIIMLLLTSFLYSALAVGTWFFFTLRVGEDAAVARERAQRTTVMALSLVVLWALGACSGLVMLLVRWLG